MLPIGQPKFGHYGGFSTYPYQFLGCLIVALTLVTFSVGFCKPSLYDIVAESEDVIAEKDAKAANDEATLEEHDAKEYKVIDEEAKEDSNEVKDVEVVGVEKAVEVE